MKGKLMAMKRKTRKEEGLPLSYVAIGTAYAVRGGKKIKLLDAASAKEGGERVVLEDGDRVLTEQGCVVSLSGAGSRSEDEKEFLSLTIYPQSEARITVGKSRGNDVLSSAELVRGLFCVSAKTEGKITDKVIIPSGYPQPEFKPLFGEFRGSQSLSAYIELSAGTMVLFSMLGRVAYKGVEAGMATGGDVKITLTRDAVYSTNLAKHPDARVEAVRKNAIALGASSLSFSGRTGPKQKWVAPVVAQKQNRESMVTEARAQLEAAQESGDESLVEIAKQQLKAAESYNPQAESAASEEAATVAKQRMEKMIAHAAQNASQALSPLPSYASPSEEEKVVRKDVRRSAKSYDMLMDEISTKNAELRAKYMKGKPSAAQALAYEMETMKARENFENDLKATAKHEGLSAQTSEAQIGESMKYRGLDYEIIRAEKGTEHGFAKSPQGKEFVLVYLRVSNNTKADAYLDPDNACSLVADGEQVASRNYEIKTDVAPGQKREGYVMFVVPQNASDFTFQLGMKSEKKLTVGFKLKGS